MARLGPLSFLEQLKFTRTRWLRLVLPDLLYHFELYNGVEATLLPFFFFFLIRPVACSSSLTNTDDTWLLCLYHYHMSLTSSFFPFFQVFFVCGALFLALLLFSCDVFSSVVKRSPLYLTTTNYPRRRPGLCHFDEKRMTA